MKKAKKFIALLCALMTLTSICVMPANAQDLGGWSEDRGYYVNENLMTRAASKPDRHFGERMNQTVPAGTQSQAHGFTQWQGVYHYTTAQMEIRWEDIVLKTSGRKYGWDYTEAYSGWWQYTPGIDDVARTYWGN